jgi:uncharacterized membrane protein YphA (DoxX/SURF4 family)
MRKIFLSALAFLLPTTALAHGKWLVPDYETIVATQHGSTPFYTFASPEVWVWVGICIVVVLVARLLHNRVPEWRSLAHLANTHKPLLDHAGQFILGVFLVATALFWNVAILPSEPVTTPLLSTLKYAQVLIGLAFIFHLAPRYAAIGLLILSLTVTISAGFEAVLENVILFSLALYFYLKHSHVTGMWVVAKKYSVDIVRIGTGISLIVLACTEKLLYPELGLAFLAAHDWNFMQPLFPWFTNELFVLSTGFAELLFGVVFIFGYMTRLTTMVISMFFLVSVLTMLYQSQVWEVEDFVVYCSATLLLFFGHGQATLPELIGRIFGATPRAPHKKVR